MERSSEALIKDLKSAVKIDKEASQIKTIQMDKTVEKVLEYALNRRIISTTKDILHLCNAVPEAQDVILSFYDNYIAKAKDNASRVSSGDYSTISGTYDRLEDVPGYGTSWNHRCIPDGVTIRSGRGSNSRC